MLDVRRLVLLRDLADHGTVTAVAELHRVTPSAVSQQLRLLEEETGSHLLERTGRAVHLTNAGRRLARDTEDVLAALERARARVHRRGDPPRLHRPPGRRPAGGPPGGRDAGAADRPRGAAGERVDRGPRP